MTLSAPKTIDDLLAVMAALRTPGSGCPWDMQQTFKTIVPYTIEEAYRWVRLASNRNQVRFSASSMKVSSNPAVAASACFSATACPLRMGAAIALLSSINSRSMSLGATN